MVYSVAMLGMVLIPGRDHPELLKVRADQQHSDVVINGISRIGYMTGGKDAR